MESFDIYKDIAERTNGDIYIGVVGPVRTGKSTFIKRFMDLLVLPNMENDYAKERAKDELPQSANGKTIMTTEPKFIPNEAVSITLGDDVHCKVRLIDCVGYVVPEAEGHLDGDSPRMVHTPWSKEPMPFVEAAELGTKKVITDHSTVGVLITTDGSITDIPRESYIQAEERIVGELKELGKPFVMVLNTTQPFAAETKELQKELSEKYDVSVLPFNCAQLKTEDIHSLMETLLYEFPMKEIRIQFPRWIETLESDHWLKKEIVSILKNVMASTNKLTEIKETLTDLATGDYVKKAYLDHVSLGEGAANLSLSVDDGLFYRILSETIDMPIENDYHLISTIKKLSEVKKNYDKIEQALSDVKRKGYGVVSPLFEEIQLEQPEVFKQGSRYGIKLKARGESIHLIKADIETEVSPIIGNEEQSKEFIDTLIEDFKTDPEKIWDLNLFGRTLQSLVNDGMQNKMYRMPEDAQLKLQETLQKIVNEGSGGLICIIL